MPYLKLCWTNYRGRFDFAAYTALVNHFANETLLTTKHQLAHALQTYTEQHRLPRIHPETYYLGDEAQFATFNSLLESEEDPIWIVKPVDESCALAIGCSTHHLLPLPPPPHRPPPL